MSTDNVSSEKVSSEKVFCECCGDLAGTIVCGTCHDDGIQSRDKSIDKLEKELAARDDVETELTKEKEAAEDAEAAMIEDLRVLIAWGLKAGANPIDARVLVSSQDAHDLLFAAPLPDVVTPRQEYQKQREADDKAFNALPQLPDVPLTFTEKTPPAWPSGKAFVDAPEKTYKTCDYCLSVNRVVRFPTAKALKQHHKDAHLPTGRKRAVRVKHFINSLDSTAAACGKPRAKGMSFTVLQDKTTCEACLDV